MREACVQLFEEYLEKNQGASHRALAETIQSVALLGLSRTDFFTYAAFYGGTALLAGKIDAILYRGWQNRVKGRDWYDFAFLVRRKVPLLLPHLEARLRQRGVYTDKSPLSLDQCTDMIARRIESVDFETAKADVAAFVPDPRDLDAWSRDYFHHVLGNL